jgi:hypothetical protein
LDLILLVRASETTLTTTDLLWILLRRVQKEESVQHVHGRENIILLDEEAALENKLDFLFLFLYCKCLQNKQTWSSYFQVMSQTGLVHQRNVLKGDEWTSHNEINY